MINELFFDLIRVAVGTQDCLSHTPTVDEWGKLYDMAKKQSLVGVCFAGVHKLVAQQQEPPEMLYLTWMGMAAKNQQRNEVVNRQCVELQAKLSADGFRSCIMKGQGIAQLYGETLSGLRQSGDIDIYVDKDRRSSIDYLESIDIAVDGWDYVHMHPAFYADTEVEWHYKVSISRNPFQNRAMQRFWDKHKEEFFCTQVMLPCGAITVPSARINVFYSLLHLYRHLFYSGIGLRQVMDFYYVLKTAGLSKDDVAFVMSSCRKFKMEKFACGIMWVLYRVFELKPEYYLCNEDSDVGSFILNEIIEGGNFGQGDKRHATIQGKHRGMLWLSIVHNVNLTRYFGLEPLTAPLFLVWHFFWKRYTMFKDNKL